MVLGKGEKPNSEQNQTFDYLQKNDPERLRQIRDTDPTEYARLAKEYSQGKRASNGN